MGEAKRRMTAAVRGTLESLGVQSLGGEVLVRWKRSEAATPFGQMAYFAEFLHLTGLYERWVNSCPLHYTSPNGSKVADVIGTLFLSVLSGHWRYAHIATLRSDAVSAGLLGMSAVVSEDTVRRALSALDEAAGMSWLQEHLDASVLALRSAPWILDTDVTVKPLYGKQEGALVGFNPHKPGRPAHAYHAYQMAGLRLMLSVHVAPGNQTHANTTLPGLIELLERLPADKRPAMVRGDCGQGGEPTMAALEARGVRYLFKLRLTKNVKRYIERSFDTGEWTDAAQGWQAQEGEIRLTGWSRSRRIVILRRALSGEVLLTDENQLRLAFVEKDIPAKLYEYAVLVTDTAYDAGAIAQLYRDRADAENAFDELKNQWGWGGFTTHDLKRCRFSAMTVALAYNWWSLFVRLAHPKARLEAITSRPLLLSGIGRLSSHAGKTRLTITPMHARAAEARSLLTAVSRRLKSWKRTAEQLTRATVWQRVCEFIATHVTGFNWLAARAGPLLMHRT
jgi:hypothetical protein